MWHMWKKLQQKPSPDLALLTLPCFARTENDPRIWIWIFTASLPPSVPAFISVATSTIIDPSCRTTTRARTTSGRDGDVTGLDGTSSPSAMPGRRSAHWLARSVISRRVARGRSRRIAACGWRFHPPSSRFRLTQLLT